MSPLVVFRVIRTLLPVQDTQPHLQQHTILPPPLQASSTKPERVCVCPPFKLQKWQLAKWTPFYDPGPSRDATIGEDTIRASLVSAVSDKLRRRMKEEMDRAQAELDALKRTEEDLKRGQKKLEEMVSKLDQEIVCLFL